MGRWRRKRVGPTGDREQLELLCSWEERREYERIKPLALFGEPMPERAETSTSERPLYDMMPRSTVERRKEIISCSSAAGP